MTLRARGVATLAASKIRGAVLWLSRQGPVCPRKSAGLSGTVIAVQGRVKKLALLAGCLLCLACTDNGGDANTGQGGHAGGQAGSTGGTTGAGGITGSAGSSGGGTGSAGTTGSGGQAAGASGSAGAAGGRGGVVGTAGNTGAGGLAGKGGQGGAGGQAGVGGGGGQSCAQIEAAYTQAIQQARMCRAGTGGAGPCPYLVSSALSCGCQIWAGDTTEIDKIKAQWNAAGCTPGIICPAIACLNPGTKASCLPNDSGDWCIAGS